MGGKKNTDFTLIELMIVIAVISILSIIAVPRFNDMIPRYRLKAAARNLQANMQKAKVQAIKEKNFKLATPASGRVFALREHMDLCLHGFDCSSG